MAELERLLAAFRKLNASLETADVLALALDEAIDVTGAERGFLLIDLAAGSWRSRSRGTSRASPSRARRIAGAARLPSAPSPRPSR